MAMTAKQTIHNYMLSAVKKSKKKIQIKCKTIKEGKEVYSAIFEGFPTYAPYIEKVKSGLNYKDFTLKFNKEWATEELYNILMDIKSNASFKVTSTTPAQTSTETPKFDDPTAPTNTTTSAPTNTTTSAPTNTTTSAPGASALTKFNNTNNASSISNKTLIIAGAAALVLVLVIVLLKRKR